MKIIRKFGRITLELDPREYFPDDPGQGTPAMVYVYKNDDILASGTFDCVLANGIVEGSKDTFWLTRKEQEWLDTQIEFVDQWFDSLSQNV